MLRRWISNRAAARLSLGRRARVVAANMNVATANSAARAVMGFRVHSGWASVVVVAGSPAKPVAVERRRIVIADPKIAGSKQPYHYVESRPLPKAAEHIARCAERSGQMARDAVRAVLQEATAKRLTMTGSALLTASGRAVAALQDALSSHTMLHTAEGEFFRRAVAEACEACGVPVTRIKEKELPVRATTTLHTPLAALQRRVTDWGRELGPPWQQDEKLAALAAWMVLAAAHAN